MSLKLNHSYKTSHRIAWNLQRPTYRFLGMSAHRQMTTGLLGGVWNSLSESQRGTRIKQQSTLEIDRSYFEIIVYWTYSELK